MTTTYRNPTYYGTEVYFGAQAHQVRSGFVTLEDEEAAKYHTQLNQLGFSKVTQPVQNSVPVEDTPIEDTDGH